MKHWLWHKSDGEVGGDSTYPGGWPAELDLNDVNETDSRVVQVRAHHVIMDDFAGFVAYECACPSGDVHCGCAAVKMGTSRVNIGTGLLEDRPAFTVLVGGANYNQGDVNDVTPGATVTLSLSGTFPDGTKVDVSSVAGEADLIQTSPQVLTFTGNVTNSINLTAPAQGLTGRVALQPQIATDTQRGAVSIRGWA